MTTIKKNSGDISSIAAHNFTLPIKHPSLGTPIGLTIELRAFTSPEVRAVQRRIQTQRIKGAARNKTPTGEQLEAQTIEQLVAATVAFHWGKNADGDDASVDGNRPEFTPEAGTKLYNDPRFPFIVSQIDEALGEEANFF